MRLKYFSLLAGLILLALGITSFLPAFSTPVYEPELHLTASYGLYLNTFVLNVVNKAALCLFGIWGLMAFFSKNSVPASVHYGRWMAYLMLPLAILGLIPATQTLFGYWPLFGADAGLHAAFGLAGAYFGWAFTAEAHHRLQPLLKP